MNIYCYIKYGKYNTLNTVSILSAENKLIAKKIFEEEMQLDLELNQIHEFSLEFLKNNCYQLINNWDIYGDLTKLAKEINNISVNINKELNDITTDNYLNKALIIQNYCCLLQNISEIMGVMYF